MTNSDSPRSSFGRWNQITIVILLAIVGYFSQTLWMPYAKVGLDWIQNKKPAEKDSADVKAASPSVDSIVLSDKAAKNIGLETGTLKLSSYTKTVPVPAIIAQRPGRSQLKITTPMTGVISRVYPLERQEVKPGSPLYDLRLTHEDVVTAQGSFLTLLQKQDVLKKEYLRLKNVGQGVVPGRRIIEQKYKVDETAASIEATRQTLLLHGFSSSQISNIEKTRKVLTDITVNVPPYPASNGNTKILPKYHVQKISVHPGQSVVAGETLGILANHSTLYIEGQAFEDDAKRLVESVKKKTKLIVTPFFGKKDDSRGTSLLLSVESLSDQVDLDSRALKFYMILPNESLEETSKNSNSFVIWKYRPGQRMEVRIPTSQTYTGQFVLPPSAVAFDGPNAFVFEQNGEGFDRIDVRVLYKSNDAIVVEKDVSLIGSTIAFKGAYHMNLALKNASGGAIDPHAGHNH